MIGKLNHVGVAVPSVDAAAEIYRTMFGASNISDIKDLPEQGVRVRFVHLENSEIELIEPLGETSPIIKFLERNPKGGQHHVCFEVDDIIQARDEMREKGATVLGTGEPRMGAHGVPVIFVHPKDFNGVLVELMQKPKSVSLRARVKSGRSQGRRY